jgi:hypothetical protein
MLVALIKIEDLARPGQELGISAAIDLICDIYNVARAAVIAHADREVSRILAMTDDEILAECRAGGEDPEAVAAEMRDIVAKASTR